MEERALLGKQYSKKQLIFVNLDYIKDEDLNRIKQILIKKIGKERVISDINVSERSVTGICSYPWQLKIYSVDIAQYIGEKIFDKIPKICEKIRYFLHEKKYIDTTTGKDIVFISYSNEEEVDFNDICTNFVDGQRSIREKLYVGCDEAIREYFKNLKKN